MKDATVVQVRGGRDPFARTTLMRRKATGKCWWCGNPAKFEYGQESDGINTRIEWTGGAYCSISCWRANAY